MRAKHTALFFTAGLLLMPTLLWSQFPGGFGGGPPGGGRPQMDPDQLFNIVSKGQDVIRVDQLDPGSKMMFDRFASRFGLSGNEITRDQFRSAMNRVREMAAAGQFPGGMNFQGGPGRGPGGGDDPDARIERRFQAMDKNQDGMLSVDEMPESLQTERDKWDTNHDGFIDLNEYRAYAQARMEARQQGGDNPRRPAVDGPNGRFDPDEADEPARKRPTILGAGNMPRDFPYATLDTDGDGQIGLYEWKASGQPIAEFLKMDLNNDGFLTVEEFYGYRKQVQDEMAKASGGSQGGDFARGGRGAGGMMAMGTGGRGMGAGGGFGMGGGPGFGAGGPAFGMGGGGFGTGGGRGRGPGGGFGMAGGGGLGMGGGPGFGTGGGGWGGGPGAGRGFGMGGGWGGGGMPQMGMGGGNWGGGGVAGGNWGGGGQGADRTFARLPGGGSGDVGPGGMPAFTPPGGDAGQPMRLVIPDVMRGPRGDGGPEVRGDRGPGGRRGGPGGGERQPRKNRTGQ